MALDLRITIRTNEEGVASVVPGPGAEMDSIDGGVSGAGTAGVVADSGVVFSLAADDDSRSVAPASDTDTASQEAPAGASQQSQQSQQSEARGLDSGLHQWREVFEYRWPPPAVQLAEAQRGVESKADWYMLQEMLSEMLGVKSFKRKYPELARRQLDVVERRHLLQLGHINEAQADAALTALKTEEVLQLLRRDYPERSDEVSRRLQEQRRRATQQAYQSARVGQQDQAAGRRAHLRAVKGAAGYNRQLLASRPAGAVCTQTLQLLLPRRRPADGQQQQQQQQQQTAYPVSILPGQFCESYRQYDSAQLGYLPLARCIFTLPRRGVPPIRLDDGAKSEQQQQQQEGGGTMVTCTVCNEACSSWRKVQCSECGSRGHAKCLQLPENMVAAARAYAWQCMDCKRCQECLDPGNEDQMIFCDRCDRGYHTFCVGLAEIPHGQWECATCVPDKQPDSPSVAKLRRLGSKKRSCAKLDAVAKA